MVATRGADLHGPSRDPEPEAGHPKESPRQPPEQARHDEHREGLYTDAGTTPRPRIPSTTGGNLDCDPGARDGDGNQKDGQERWRMSHACILRKLCSRLSGFWTSSQRATDLCASFRRDLHLVPFCAHRRTSATISAVHAALPPLARRPAPVIY